MYCKCFRGVGPRGDKHCVEMLAGARACLPLNGMVACALVAMATYLALNARLLLCFDWLEFSLFVVPRLE